MSNHAQLYIQNRLAGPIETKYNCPWFGKFSVILMTCFLKGSSSFLRFSRETYFEFSVTGYIGLGKRINYAEHVDYFWWINLRTYRLVLNFILWAASMMNILFPLIKSLFKRAVWRVLFSFFWQKNWLKTTFKYRCYTLVLLLHTLKAKIKWILKGIMREKTLHCHLRHKARTWKRLDFYPCCHIQYSPFISHVTD